MMFKFFVCFVIEILHQTTTMYQKNIPMIELYLIEILHQTTTSSHHCPVLPGCILLKFYIKPQLMDLQRIVPAGCILLKFYIKPQQPVMLKFSGYELYLIEILHQTTTFGTRR